jgi:hypothetical protein
MRKYTLTLIYVYTHALIHIYIYIYISACVDACVCVYMLNSLPALVALVFADIKLESPSQACQRFFLNRFVLIR